METTTGSENYRNIFGLSVHWCAKKAILYKRRQSMLAQGCLYHRGLNDYQYYFTALSENCRIIYIYIYIYMNI